MRRPRAAIITVTVIVVESGMTGPDLTVALGGKRAKPFRFYRVKMEPEEVERMIAERRRLLDLERSGK